MIVIRCPYCDELRHEEELEYGGEAEIVRPAPPESVSDEEWAAYLYMRTNTKGHHHEQWCCRAGCGQWFKVVRDTVSHEVHEILRFDGTFSHPTEE
ncbi:MAG: sarcosine oxidase subunit delta [Proteobacteria bacterium]|nr:sarcosine oxidase subunit delta [Pseudomonadota bacterium]